MNQVAMKKKCRNMTVACAMREWYYTILTPFLEIREDFPGEVSH